MVDDIGAAFHSPQSYGQQMPPWQQPPSQWGGQMGTRGVEGQQQQVQPGGFQGQVGQQQPGLGMPQPGVIAPHEKAVLRGVLDILKEGRVALATGAIDGLVAQRLTAAHAYFSGFLEAKGQAELGGYLKTIPPLNTRGTLGDARYDQMLDQLEQLVSPETRFWGPALKVAGQVVISAAGSALWDATKWAHRRITGG